MGDINQEKEAFDNQIIERIQNGHIPDLRQVEDCDYFYNNPWRRKAYVELDMIEQFHLIRDKINEYSLNNSNIRILEVGCGPGYMALELSRCGYDVVGIDISRQALNIANEYANKDPWKDERGSLKYEYVDFFEYEDEQPFDVVLFVGSLHHFKNQDEVMSKINTLLSSDGLVIAHEPTRDRVTVRNASVSLLIEVLLSASGNYFQSIQTPTNMADLESQIQRKFMYLKYEDEEGHKRQSPNDNEAGFTMMIHALRSHYNQLYFEDRYGIFHELIGGLRFEEPINNKLSKFIHDLDKYFCSNNIIDATEFLFVGRK